MKISLITVSYNSEKTIRETFESVRGQKIEGFELEYIHVDGLSNDATMEISQEFNDIITTRISEKDSGIYNAMNKGIKMATGDIIGILNSDDCYASQEILQSVVNAFEENECDAVYADLHYVRRHDSHQITRKWKSGLYKKNSFFLGWMPPHPTFFLRKEFYDNYGFFNEKIKSSADYELMLRMIKVRNASLHYIPKLFVNMKDGGNSNQSLSHRIKVFTEDRYAWKLNFSRPGYVPIILKILRKVNQFTI